MDHHDVAARAAMTAADNEDRSASARAAAQVDAREDGVLKVLLDPSR